MMMDEPCFDILRTREQLGYGVFCDFKNTSGIIGICVIVATQADNFRSVHRVLTSFYVAGSNQWRQVTVFVQC